MNKPVSQVGITTTIPVEAVYASMMKPVDLNNMFIDYPDRQSLFDLALRDGFPQNTCAWTKGIYGAVIDSGIINKVIGVVRGDCSGGEILLEAFDTMDIEVIPFSYPYPPSRRDLQEEIERLCGRLGTCLEDAELQRGRLDKIRRLLHKLDAMCWEDNKVSGMENHFWLVSSSDFWGDPENFYEKLTGFLEDAGSREPLDLRGGLPYSREIRLGYLGVPPITPQVFNLVEEMGARVVYHEIQRQFSMPEPADDLVDMYLNYTYPYTLRGRSIDINRECGLRGIDGLVHYVQSFCHRNMENVIFNKTLKRPVLTIECDGPGSISATTRARLENFVQVLGENI